MPGIPLVSREVNYSRESDQMCRQEPPVHLTEEELTAAEESLSVYCKPVELYNILQRRAIKNPSFLQRCLQYKLEEKNKRRIRVVVSISKDIGNGLQTRSLFPLYIVLARPAASTIGETRRSNYRFKRACKLTSCNGAQAKFVMPEINELSREVKNGTVAMLLVSCADITNSNEIDLTKDQMFSSSNVGCYCLLGKIPIDFLQLEKSPNLSLGQKVDVMKVVSMQSCYMKLSCSDEEKCLSFQFPYNSEAVSILQQVPVIMSAEELGAKDISPYDLYSYNNVATHCLPDFIRLRKGNVMFNYKYYNNLLHRTEVTEDYSCPFCLVKCASYKGLRCHLNSSHDLFRYEFWVNEDYQVVVVSPRIDTNSSEIFGKIVDPREEPVLFWKSQSQSQSQNANQVRLLALNSDIPAARTDLRGVVPERVEREVHIPNEIGATNAAAADADADADIISGGPESASQSVPENNLAPPELLQFAKTRKLSVERSDPRSQMLLQKRHFFHSHRAQPMALEQVLGDEDSEDEVDDDVADLEDRRMLDDFWDVTQYEKQMMHLWNSFVRKQRVLADAHVPWSCEAFTKQHGRNLIKDPQLNWCWKLFMVKLWKHGLIDPKTMNNCHRMLHNYQNESQNIDPPAA